MELGLDTYKQHEQVDDGVTVARISLSSANIYKVMHLDGSETTATPKNRTTQFLVGDWVVIDPQLDFDLISERLPRYSTLGRITGDRYQAQEKEAVSNLDQLFICISMNKNLSDSRINRYRYAFQKDNEYQTSLVLTKSDLWPDAAQLAAQLADELGVAVLCTSSLTGAGIADLQASILPGQTVSFYGNSGVGKSSLVNAVAQEEVMATQQISARTDKGRHTTTSSRLFPISRGDFILVDTPGIKSVGVGTNDLAMVFPEIVDLGKGCRFHDCTHKGEPGCAVQAAVNNGQLDQQVYQQFISLQAESQATQTYLDAKIAKKLMRKARDKKQAVSKRHYRKPPM
ncbi:ribosome small subunit-dependent GTPase A [Lactobacillus xylocopicola]|uniref:Small ribosomal subunit biogenesis GTPase RsgA n=1 Tax=Lactobacillus xylocopicola TaxID=2976676 RepID=A0ABM8BGB8_9LACO|nr:ribosome small subunit-dependent GTPase A [Lactobacillus xylocopicola]BDR60302.1 putative ribosome biogenesis GTPase RsgA [Lactobacillus xylocopicola]